MAWILGNFITKFNHFWKIWQGFWIILLLHFMVFTKFGREEFWAILLLHFMVFGKSGMDFGQF